MPRASGVTSNLFPPTRANSSIRWNVRMSTSSRVFLLPSPSNRKQLLVRRAPPSAPSPKFTTTFASSMLQLACRIVPIAAIPSRASGLVTVAVVGGKEHVFSEKLACPDCGISVPILEPRSFSFNSPYGACPACNGLGSKYDFDPAKIFHDWSRPLFDGGLGPGSASPILKRTLELAAYAHGFDLDTPFDKFPQKIQNLLLYGYPPSGGPGAKDTAPA